jgi:spore coat protein U-like protein
MLFKKSTLFLATSILSMGAHATLPSVATNVPISISVSTSNPATACTVTMLATSGSLTYVSGATNVATQYRNANISCNGNDAIAYTVSAGSGANPSATSRRAISGANLIDYNLSSMQLMGAAFDTVFGGSSITGTTVPSGTVSTGSIGFQVNVPAGQTPASGTYTDTVVLTTTF